MQDNGPREGLNEGQKEGKLLKGSVVSAVSFSFPTWDKVTSFLFSFVVFLLYASSSYFFFYRLSD